jgi:hypothetical protein
MKIALFHREITKLPNASGGKKSRKTRKTETSGHLPGSGRCAHFNTEKQETNWVLDTTELAGKAKSCSPMG